MISPNRGLLITFVVLAVFQTAVPILGQMSTRAMVYRELLHLSIALCLLTGIIVTLWQVASRRFSTGAIVLFDVGIALLVGLDLWIEFQVGATC